MKNLREMERKFYHVENRPLTLDELRKMDGLPVWCVDGFGNEMWCLVNVSETGVECVDSKYGCWREFYFEMQGDGLYGLHTSGWRAFRRELDRA